MGIGLGSTNSWVKSTFVVVVVVVAVVVKALTSKLALVSTTGVEAVKSILLTSKFVFVVSTAGSEGMKLVESKLFKAEVAPIAESVVVKSKVLVSKAGVEVVIFPKSTLGSTDWKVSAL